MKQLGTRRDVYDADRILVKQPWHNLPSQSDYPTNLRSSHHVVCGFGEGENEELAIAHSYSDMVKLHHIYWQGQGGTKINWYISRESLTLFDEDS